MDWKTKRLRHRQRWDAKDAPKAGFASREETQNFRPILRRAGCMVPLCPFPQSATAWWRNAPQFPTGEVDVRRALYRLGLQIRVAVWIGLVFK